MDVPLVCVNPPPSVMEMVAEVAAPEIESRYTPGAKKLNVKDVAAAVTATDEFELKALRVVDPFPYAWYAAMSVG